MNTLIDKQKEERERKEIADSIRTKGGTTGLLNWPEGYKSAVESLSGKPGRVWKQSSLTTGTFGRPARGLGIWVVAGPDGIYSSQDGKTWSKTLTVEGDPWASAYGGGTFVVSKGYKAYYADASLAWAPANMTGDVFVDIQHDGRMFAAVGTSGIWTSVDGTLWDNEFSPAADLNRICGANGRWFASSSTGVWERTTATRWTRKGPKVGTNGIASQGKSWAAAGDQPLYSADNGASWNVATGADGKQLGYVAAGNGIWVAASGVESNGICWTRDPATWTASQKKTGTFGGVAYGGGVFLTTDTTGRSFWSEDGDVWNLCTFDGENKAPTITKFVYADGMWVGASLTQGIWYSD